MANFINFDQPVTPVPGAPTLTPEQIAFDEKMKTIPITNMTVQWMGDIGVVANQYGHVFQFTREQWLDWFDRAKAAFEYAISGGAINPYKDK